MVSSPKPSSYHLLSVSAKQALQRGSAHEMPLRCVTCGVAVMADDLLTHAEQRCERPPAHPHARWLGWPQARQLGLSRSDLHRLARRGVVRTAGTPKRKLYLARDVVQVVATRRWLAGRRTR